MVVVVEQAGVEPDATWTQVQLDVVQGDPAQLLLEQTNSPAYLRAPRDSPSPEMSGG